MKLSRDYKRARKGTTLVEVMVAFTVLLLVLMPLSYLFTEAFTVSTQSASQLTALSIAEKYIEVLSNTAPPLNAASQIIVNTPGTPEGPGSTTISATTSLPASSIPVVSATSLPSSGYAVIMTSTGPQTVAYTGTSAGALTGATGGSGTASIGASVYQDTPTETRGGVQYSISTVYYWASAQNNSTTTTTTTTGGSLPMGTIHVTSTSGFIAATTANPQVATVISSAGPQIVNYTGETGTTLTGVSGGAGTVSSGATVSQASQPNLCTAGTPSLLRLFVTVSWGADVSGNSMTDSTLINYPPSGVQTSGYLALQFSGNSGTDAQGDSWSTRVQSIPVTVTGTANYPAIYPDSYGCAFIQVPQGTYTVGVGNPPTAYPSFVANGTGTVTNNVLQQPTSESASGINVTTGAVTYLATALSNNYPGFDQGATISLSYPSSTSVADGVVCPNAGNVTCISTGQNASGAVATLDNQGSWSSLSLPGTVSRLASVACASSTECIGVGYAGSSGAIVDISTGTTPAATTDAQAATALSGVTALTSVSCPTSSRCVAIGTTATGPVVLSGSIVSPGSNSWSVITLPGTTSSLSNLTCPVGGTGCAALGTSTSPANGTPIVSSGGFSGSWISVSPSGSLTSLTALTCASDTACMASGATASNPLVVVGTTSALGTSGLSWTTDSAPGGTTITSVSSITCPSSSDCLVAGLGTQGAGTVPLVLYAIPTASQTLAADTLPGSLVSVSSVSCPSSSVCVGVGQTASGTAIIDGTITSPGSADTWLNVTVPSVSGTLSTLTSVVCPNVSYCLANGTGTNNAGQPTAFLLSNSLTLTNWAATTLPATNPADYFGAVSCVPGATNPCSAVGASPTGAVVLTSTTGPSGIWTDVTPSGLTGVSATGIPVESNSPGQLPSPYANVVTSGAVSNITQLPDVYPQNGGYNLFAGNCAAELGSGGFNVVSTNPTPGGTASATIPLGNLGIYATTSSGALIGAAYAGATVSITSTTASCTGVTYTLPTTGPDGLSRAQVPYGTYTLSVTGGSTVTEAITVDGSTVTSPAGTIPASSPIQIVAGVPLPDAPTGVSATGGNAQASVSWTAATTNGGPAITGYTVTSSPGGLTCTTATTGCTVTGLSNGTSYTFTVKATNSIGTSPASTVSNPVTPIGPPGAPTGVTASSNNNAAVPVSWTAPASNGGSSITGYTATSTPGGLTCSTAGLNCTVTGLSNGTSYTFKVTATNAAGTGTASTASNSATPATVPGAPSGVNGTSNANAQSVITWTAPASNGGSSITGYTATSSPGGLTCSTAGLTCTVSGLSNGTSYTFTVKATNGAGTGPASAASAAVIPATTPGVPTSVVAAATSLSTTASISWTAPVSNGGAAITAYTATSSVGGLTCSSATLNCTVTGLTTGNTYTFTVKATNVAGTGSASAASNSLTIGLPGAPTSVVATATGVSTSATITWTAPANGGSAITTYKATATGGLNCSSATTSCVVTGLTAGTTYTFTVTATNSHGTGPASAISNSLKMGLPGAPNGVSGTSNGGNQSVVSWSAAQTGGSAITLYVVTASPGGFTCNTSGLSCTVTGLTHLTPYTFTVTATNANGTGPASVASAPATP